MEEIINLTKHGILRYLQRVKGVLVTDANYDQWKQSNQEFLEAVKKEIQSVFENSLYLTTGTYGNHKKAIYYVNKELMIIFILDGKNMVTIYKIDFNLDEVGNKEMLDVLYSNYLRLLDEEEKVQAETEDYIKKLNQEIQLKGSEIQSLESELHKIRTDKKELEARKENLKAITSNISQKIEGVKQKIILSKKVF